MPLTILQAAYPLAPVGRDATGGAEQVVALLDAALVRAGHVSLVVAGEGSAVCGTLVPTPAFAGLLDGRVRELAADAHCKAIAEALRRHPVDVVHLHGVDFLGYLPPPGPPVLATLHLPPSWYPPEVFRLDRPATRLACVSAAQRRACPPAAVPVETVPNGVDLEALRPGPRRRGFALALGRICPEKGFHHALDAATLAGVPLALGGRVFRYGEHESYFGDEIAPRLGPGRHFLGPLPLPRKRRLLAAARCLLVPSEVPETSSLVAMEALACGTPVVAFTTGALPEIVEDGRTGFLVSGVREMAAAIRRAGEIDPGACRAAAEERFSAVATAARYLDLYRALAAEAVPAPAGSTGEGELG